ncbi:hypothetical protein [Gordonia sp. i37]|uniref:hypothetical protein n=1 Tax=Gordonia sp. i37 TaxID=1961707 RepID=UPI0011199CEF|nr:hypothetical protein [Gordonia sp. i37]
MTVSVVDDSPITEDARDDVAQIPAEQLAQLFDIAAAAEYVAEQKDTSSLFKLGGYGMFNRPWLWKMLKASTMADWIKVAAYCWTHHGMDGHCRVRGDFGPIVLGKTVTASNASRLVKRAVQEGALGVGSNPRCLVAPWGVRFRTTADVYSSCGLHP